MAVDDRDTDVEPVDLYVGPTLRNNRKAAGMSQNTLAEALHISPQQIQKYETGRCRISASKMNMPARTLKVPVGSLFAGYGEAEAADPDPDPDITVARARRASWVKRPAFPFVLGIRSLVFTCLMSSSLDASRMAMDL